MAGVVIDSEKNLEYYLSEVKVNVLNKIRQNQKVV